MKKCKYQEKTPKGYYDHCKHHKWFRPLVCVDYLRCPTFKPTTLYKMVKTFKALITKIRNYFSYLHSMFLYIKREKM